MIRNGKTHFRRAALCWLTVFSAMTASFHTFAEEIPEGFYRMPDGRFMAKDLEHAKAPPGYYLRRNGTLVKLNLDGDSSPAPAIKPIKPGEVPPGYHKRSDGAIVADDPKTAIVPPGYHLMSGGVLMSNTSMGGGGHHHGKGMWMFDYKYTHMYMKDMLDASKRVTASEAVDPNGAYKYMMAPVDMSMDMHMLMIMYGISDSIMPMLMLHYMSSEMSMLAFDGGHSTMKSSGLADTILSTMIQGPHHLNFDVGISIPTGSIDVTGPMQHSKFAPPVTQKYGYGMQLGSGSYELIHGIRYEDYSGDLGWGGGYSFTAPLNKNDNGYKRGNKLLVDSWLQWTGIKAMSFKGKLQYRSIGQIVGVDPEIEKDKIRPDGSIMSPLVDASGYGGNRLDATFIYAYKIPSPMLTFSFEFSKPVY
ncbi:MAG: hypothetical protein R3240_10445, partial [Gammaproteobacteria bacterium]|nr:hypothetical protein [Gammaproteobacteria bacterium]